VVLADALELGKEKKGECGFLHGEMVDGERENIYFQIFPLTF
jgi:hypothetical protein